MKELIESVKDVNGESVIVQTSGDLTIETGQSVQKVELMIFHNFELNSYHVAICCSNLNHYFLQLNMPKFKELFDEGVEKIEIRKVTEVEDLKEEISSKNLVFSKIVKIYYSSKELDAEQTRLFASKFKEEGYSLRFISPQELHVLIKSREKVLDSFEKKIKELETYLVENPNEIESKFHNIIESDKRLVDMYANGYITKPKNFKYPNGKVNINGHNQLIPDFLLTSIENNYTLVEIERPNKEPITLAGNPSYQYTQAASQINQWEVLINDCGIKLEEFYPGISKKNKRRFFL